MTQTPLDVYRTDPARFIEDYLPLNEKGQPWRLSAHQRRVLQLGLQWGPSGLLLVRLLIWGEMKKSGKTILAAALLLWWAFTRPWTEVVSVANDMEQAIGRVFRTACALIHHNGLTDFAEVRAKTISLTNGTLIEAIPSDYAGEAGRRHSLVVFDEPWGIMSERAQRLYEELTPPPTEPEAWMLMTTYAGFSGESKLLEQLYQDTLKGERLDDDLELFRKGSVTMFWSHTPRQPWQTEAYYTEQRQTLRPNAFRRLHENQWVTGTEAFISGDEWDACIDEALSPILGPFGHPTVIGVDASFKHDTSAAVAVQFRGDKIVLVDHRIWKPSPQQPLDLELTIEQYLLDAHRRGQVRAIVCDPYQMHRSITTLQRAGLPIRELPQTQGNVTAFGQTLFDLIKGKNLRIYPAAELREQALNAVAVESARGWRLAKDKTSRKIDAIVALAMACHEAIGQGAAAQFGTAVLPYWMGKDTRWRHDRMSINRSWAGSPFTRVTRHACRAGVCCSMPITAPAALRMVRTSSATPASTSIGRHRRRTNPRQNSRSGASSRGGKTSASRSSTRSGNRCFANRRHARSGVTPIARLSSGSGRTSTGCRRTSTIGCRPPGRRPHCSDTPRWCSTGPRLARRLPNRIRTCACTTRQALWIGRPTIADA
jgi:hypothetical protein